MVTAMGVSIGLTAGGDHVQGHHRARRSAGRRDLLTLDKIGAWAITEPGSGSDAFGSMKATARRDGDGYVLNGNKTFITNGPYADTIVFICKLDEGNDPKPTARS
jgi:alkylation response protein AidB-like acyl-CoA dehydrogenase